jgi:hypothetical protein
MDNWLKEFEELLLENALLKCKSNLNKQKSKIERMVVDHTKNYKGTNPIQFGNCSCR